MPKVLCFTFIVCKLTRNNEELGLMKCNFGNKELIEFTALFFNYTMDLYDKRIVFLSMKNQKKQKLKKKRISCRSFPVFNGAV